MLDGNKIIKGNKDMVSRKFSMSDNKWNVISYKQTKSVSHWNGLCITVKKNNYEDSNVTKTYAWKICIQTNAEEY